MASLADREAEDLLSSYRTKFKQVKGQDGIDKLAKSAAAMAKLAKALHDNKATSTPTSRTAKKSNTSDNAANMIAKALDKQAKLLAELTKNNNKEDRNEEKFKDDDEKKETVKHLGEIVKLLKIIAKEEAPSLLGSLLGGRRGGGLMDMLDGGRGGRRGRGKGLGKAFSSVEGLAEEAEEGASLLAKPGRFARYGAKAGGFITKGLDALGPAGTALRFGGKGLGSVAKLGGRLAGGIEEMVPGLGLVLGGSQEIGDLSDLSKKRGTSFFGDKDTGIMDSRAAGYGKSALNGAMAGASIGTFLGGPVGTAIGGGIGAGVGLAAAAYTDYKPQIDKVVGSLISGGKTVLKKTWDGIYGAASKAYKFVVNHLPSWEQIKDGAKTLADVALDPVLLVKPIMNLISDISKWIYSKIPTLQDLKDAATGTVKTVKEAAATTGKAVVHAVEHPIETAKATGKALVSGAKSAGHAVVSGAKAVGGALSKASSAVGSFFSSNDTAPKTPGEFEGTDKEKAYLNQAMDKQGITDPKERAALAATIAGESHFKTKSEDSYAHTSADRIMHGGKNGTPLFSALNGMSNAEVDKLKSDPKAFFNKVYGNKNGNKGGDDGYNYRGRGLIQLTGRGNYEKYGKMVGVDLIKNPDLANDPKIAAQIASAYTKDRYKGNGFEGVKRAVGTAVGNTEGVKDKAYQEYLASGEFAPGKASLVDSDTKTTDRAPITVASNDKNNAPPAQSQTASDNYAGQGAKPSMAPKAQPPIQVASTGNNNKPYDIDEIPMMLGDSGLIYSNSGMNT